MGCVLMFMTPRKMGQVQHSRICQTTGCVLCVLMFMTPRRQCLRPTQQLSNGFAQYVLMCMMPRKMEQVQHLRICQMIGYAQCAPNPNQRTRSRRQWLSEGVTGFFF